MVCVATQLTRVRRRKSPPNLNLRNNQSGIFVNKECHRNKLFYYSSFTLASRNRAKVPHSFPNFTILGDYDRCNLTHIFVREGFFYLEVGGEGSGPKSS